MATYLHRLPPFGFMADGFQEAVPKAPPPWAMPVLDFSSALVWPKWDHQAGGWIGASSANSVSLTQRDLEAMSHLSSEFNSRARHTNSPGPSMNSGMFEAEDDLAAPYDREWRDKPPFGYGVPLEMRLKWALKCNDSQAEILADAFRDGSDVVTEGLFWLKWMLQRPRAHQAAFLLQGDMYAFRYSLAKSAWSPSAISGHALQGLMGCLHAHLRSPMIEPDALADLAIDIGDRRVLAGVHYPTDNLLSWFAAWEYVAYQERKNGWTSTTATLARNFIRKAVLRSTVLVQLQSYSEFESWQAALPDLLASPIK